jgi:hypothetical protein
MDHYDSKVKFWLFCFLTKKNRSRTYIEKVFLKSVRGTNEEGQDVDLNRALE